VLAIESNKNRETEEPSTPPPPASEPEPEPVKEVTSIAEPTDLLVTVYDIALIRR
jgi:hypothetical protein